MQYIDLRDDRSENVRYDFKDYPIYIRKALLSSYYNFEAAPHWHDDIEFIAVLSGEMDYKINGETITMRANEGMFVNGRQLHYGFSQNKIECEFICVLLHPALLCATAVFEEDFIVPLLKNQGAAFIKLSSDTGWKKEILTCIRNMYSAKETPAAPLAVTALFFKIWSLIYANANIDTAQNDREDTDDLVILKNMIGYIQQNYCEKITLGDIAQAGAVGQSKCCKLFGKYTGGTPNTYLTRHRLSKSVWYLENTHMTVTEIAGAVGFSGGSYYAEAFKKRYGKSPSAYRKISRAM